MTESNPLQMTPGATLDLSWNWAFWIPANDSIVSFDVTTTASVIRNSQSKAKELVTAFVTLDAAVLINSRHSVRCTVSTAAGRTDTRTIYLTASIR